MERNFLISFVLHLECVTLKMPTYISDRNSTKLIAGAFNFIVVHMANVLYCWEYHARTFKCSMWQTMASIRSWGTVKIEL